MEGPATPTTVSVTPTDTPNDRVPLSRRELALTFGFWTFIALLTTANALLDARGRGLHVLPLAPVTLSFAESYVWALATPFVFWLANRFPLEKINWGRRLALFLVAGLVMAVGVDLFTNWLRADIFFLPRGLPPRPDTFERIVRVWFLNEFLIYVAVLAAGLAREYSLRYHARREEAIRLHAEAAQLQAQLADARLAALRSQLNPHFLFNTLHAVSALVERDPRGVRRMIARLSELLRTTLEGAEEQEVPLEQEMTFIQRYLEIMQIRFQGRLEIQRQIDMEASHALVPNLILQPLVENAIKHGVSKINDVGRITIYARREGERLVLGVRDNGPELSDTDLRTESGVGLTNSRARLVQMYGSDQTLVLRPNPPSGVIAEVTLPYHTRADLHTAGVAASA